MYPRRPSSGFGNQNAGRQTRLKPLKRPLQARAKFTVQAIYDAFVRIWRKHGWEGVSTRAVALEAGVSVGTLYEYFPNKHALLSGYVRHCIDVLLEEIDRQVIAPPAASWEQRIHRLVRLTCGIDVAELPYFDSEMLSLENQIAEQKHHRRVFDELSAKWIAAVDACTDLPGRAGADTVKALFLSIWGGRRYLMLVKQQGLTAAQWAIEMERLCRAAFLQPGDLIQIELQERRNTP